MISLINLESNIKWNTILEITIIQQTFIYTPSSKLKNLDNVDIYLVDSFGETKKFHKIASSVFLGGSIYSINMLPDFWQKVSLLNPVLYLVSGFRWSFYEIADVSIYTSL